MGSRDDAPDTLSPNITGCLLLEKGADLLDLGTSRGGVEQQVAQLARIRLHIDSALGRPRIALQDQNLVLWATFLLDRVHGAGELGARGAKVVEEGLPNGW